MNEIDEVTQARRTHRFLQWFGFFAMLHLVYSSWYVPDVMLLLLPCSWILWLLIFGSHLRVGLMDCDGFFSAVGGLIRVGLGFYGYMMLVGILFFVLTSFIGCTTTARSSAWQNGGFVFLVLLALLPIPRRAAAAMLVLGIFLPLCPDPAEACMTYGTADPTGRDYAAYALFVTGSVRLFSYAARRYLAEGLDESPESAPSRPKIRRAVGPISDVAPIRVTRSGSTAAPTLAGPRRTLRTRAVPPTPRPAPVHIALKIDGAHCPVCASGFAEGPASRIAARVVTCSTCATPHHAECFAFSAGCAMYACGSDAAVTLA